MTRKATALTIALLILLGPALPAAAQNAAQLKNVQVESRTDGVTIKIATTGTPSYSASLIDTPNRLVIDVNGAAYAWTKTRLNPDVAPIPYEAKGRRDPFTPVVIASGGKGLTIGSAKLVGVIQGRTSPLALVETAEGIGYILKAGDTLGDGRVTEVGVDFVSFAVTPRPGGAGSSVTLRLRTD